VASACTDDAISGPGFRCDVTNPVVEVFVAPSSSVIFVHTPPRETDTALVVATATNRVGGVRTDVPIKFVSSDTLVAIVDSLGVVHARKPGTVRISASSCGESASTELTVTALPVTVKVKLDTAAVISGDSVLVTAQAVTPDGATVKGAKFTFASSPATGITILQRSDSTAIIKSAASGTFTISATGEGTTGTATLTVAPRIFVATASNGTNTLDLGRDFGCGLIPLGRLYCWGVNGFAQLGARTDSLCFEELKAPGQSITQPCSLSPIRVGPAIVASSVSAGDGFACGITTQGSAYCWGDGSFGKIGNGKLGSSSTPTLVTSGLTFASVTVGGEHACGLTPSGAAYCWGQDVDGQLGDARRVNSTTPIPVSGGPGSIAVFASMSAGFRHTCAIQGTVAFCWGRNDRGELGLGTNGGTLDTPGQVVGGLQWSAISAGGDTVQQPPPLRFESHTCGLTTSGQAFCWGSNESGQLGIGIVGGSSAVPVAVSGGLTFSRISAGARHTCGLTTGGVVYCWGHNQDLQLGRGPGTGSDVDSGNPQAIGAAVGGPAGLTFTSVSAGTRHSCAIGSDGAAYCWGSNVFGALGNTLQAAFRGFPQRVATPQ
jgi:alpha-tubulin suppressor-like RCC1 family protein